MARNERTMTVNDVMFFVWEDDTHQHVTAVHEDEQKLVSAGMAMRKDSNWESAKIGPNPDNPGLYSLYAKRSIELKKKTGDD